MIGEEVEQSTNVVKIWMVCVCMCVFDVCNAIQEVGGVRPEKILESETDSAEWSLEVERVLPQLKVTIQSDIKVHKSHFIK